MSKWSIKTKSGKGRILYTVAKNPGIHINGIGSSTRIYANVEELIESGYIYSILSKSPGGYKKQLYLTEAGKKMLDTILESCKDE